MAYDIVSAEPSHTVALVDDHVVALFLPGPTEASIVSAWDRALKRRASRSTAVFFGIVDTESLPPESAARAAISGFFESHGDRIAACAVIVEGVGFRAALGHAVVTAVMSITPRSRFPFPRRTVRDVEEGVEWAASVVTTVDVQSTLQSIRELRASNPGHPRGPAS